MDADAGLRPTERVGVLLLNLGGPETLADVQPFLYNLFADDSIIRLPPYGEISSFLLSDAFKHCQSSCILSEQQGSACNK